MFEWVCMKERERGGVSKRETEREGARALENESERARGSVRRNSGVQLFPGRNCPGVFKPDSTVFSSGLT